jgi:hypothetical protein
MLRFCQLLLWVVSVSTSVNAWSHTTSPSLLVPDSVASRRDFFSKISTATLLVSSNSFVGFISPESAIASSPEVVTTSNGIKYATIKTPTGKGYPQDKDIVAIEYTGYLTDGTIFGT